MIGQQHIESLPSCEDGCEEESACEMKQALLYLNQQSTAYGTFTPALAPITKTEESKRFLAIVLHATNGILPGDQSRISRIEVASESGDSTIGPATTSELFSNLTSDILIRSTSGSLLVTAGKDLGILDIFLEQFGELLCDAGYVLEPRISGSSLSYLRISRRGGRESWSLVYAETMSGVNLSTFHGYARDAGYHVASVPQSLARRLYGATAAYQELILMTFGVALCPTVGMIALRCVRHCLPDVPLGDEFQSFRKWRPDPLLVAMERVGRGYRGGMTYAERYRGPATRLDVIRQYTAALATPLPYRSAFGRWRGPDDNGIFVCRLRVDNAPLYPVGVWRPDERRFQVTSVSTGSYVCILHTSEFPGLQAHGATVAPWYGFRFTHTFTLSEYVQRLQCLLDLHGYASHLSKLIKPLGNYVYGKFGQDPHRKELRFSKESPGKPWYAYIDDNLRDWPMVWERDTTAYTSSQHVEIAGTITGAARSQTMSMWGQCVMYGATVVRCHTDSLTVATESLPVDIADQMVDAWIGSWREEYSAGDSYIVAPNAFTDNDGAHIAGVTDPTREMIERVYNGEVVEIIQTEKTPLAGFARRDHEVRKRFG